MRNVAPALLAALALAACAARPLPLSASLPPGFVEGGTDPLRAAVLGSAFAFNSGGTATPSGTARAAALVEYMATDSKWGGRWADFSPVTLLRLEEARSELREALAIPADAPPQEVVMQLSALANSLDANVPVAPTPQAQATVARLAALPGLPRTREATALAERDLLRIDQERLFQGGPGGGGGASRS